MTRILGDAFGQAKVSDSSQKKSGYSFTQRSLQYESEGHEDNKYYKSPNRFSYYPAFQVEENNQMMHGSHDVRDTIAGIEGYGVVTNKANRINEGIITEYPFTIYPELTISPTAYNKSYSFIRIYSKC